MSQTLFAIGVIAAGVVLVMSESNDTRPDAMQTARTYAMKVIASAPRRSTIVMDFDETIVFPKKVHSHVHGFSESHYRRDHFASNRRSLPIYAPIREMIDVCKYANANDMRVVIITARQDTPNMHDTIRANARHHGFTVDEVYGFNPSIHQLSTFKAGIRRHMHAKGMNVVLTIGDRWPDVNGSNGAHWIKLPTSDGISRSSQS